MKSRVALVALFVVLLTGTGSPVGQGSSLPGSQSGVPTMLPASGWGDTAVWHRYENEEYGFQIKYPDSFIPAEHANELVSSGAVVTFIPTFDPSIDGSGAITNLYEVSVTIGVSDASAPLAGQDAFCDADAHERRLQGQWKVGSVCFAGYHFSEAAVGNRYEKLSYRTAFGGTCYEIALFVHYGSPYCYSPGAVKAFDPIEILRLFYTMVGTFLPPTGDCCGSR